MAKITFFGDFKADRVKRLNLSAELVYLLNTSDVNVVNFEAPIVSNGKPIRKSGPNICQHVDAPVWLETRGFNAISLANNHAMDYGVEGFQRTADSFERAAVIGAGNWNDAYKVHVFHTADNKKIGIICCTHCEFGTLTDKFTVSCGCAWSLSPEILRMIKMSGGGVDALIIYNHGGIEYMDMPLPEWRDVYRMWIDLGADAVIASHPHVPQGYEFYKGKPICYSLGNFCFDKIKYKTPPQWNESLCCIMDINEPHQVNMEVRPIIYDPACGYIAKNGGYPFKETVSRRA